MAAKNKAREEVARILTELTGAGDCSEEELLKLQEEISQSSYSECIEHTNKAMGAVRTVRAQMEQILRDVEVSELLHGLQHIQEDMPIPQSMLSRWCISFIKDVAVDFQKRVIDSVLKGKKETEY